MTSGRDWLDTDAEKKFWALMREYETLRANRDAGSRGLASLVPSPFRDRRSRQRMGRIETEARDLVERFSAPVPPAQPQPEPAQGEAHPFLRIAATLANDPGSRDHAADAAKAAVSD